MAEENIVNGGEQPGAGLAGAGIAFRCWAGDCRHNSDGMCAFKGVEIGAKGKCLSYERRSRKSVELYLRGRGLTQAEIDHVLKEAGYGGGAD